MVGYLWAESPSVPFPFLVAQRPDFLCMTPSRRIAGRSQVLHTVKTPVCLGYSNIPGFLPGREVTGGSAPDLESEMVFPEQGWQKAMDVEGPCSWRLKFYHTGLPETWRRQLCGGQ